MVDVSAGVEGFERAAWRVGNLPDFGRRLERAARRMDEATRERGAAAFVIYESALTRSGRPLGEVFDKVRLFAETFEDEEEPMTIPRASSILNTEGDSWFFDSPALRTLTGQLLGQFQHRVAQYNYIDEREVLKRWANSYDTKLFIRRRIHDTEPVVGVVEGVDLPLLQYLRVAAGGDTVVPTTGLARALVALDLLKRGDSRDEYAVLAAAEGLALRMDLPAPILGEILEELAYKDRLDFPTPPEPEPVVGDEGTDEDAGTDTGAGPSAASTEVGGRGGTDADEARPAPADRASRRAARERSDRGEEPTRVQDPQAKDAPGVQEEAGSPAEPAGPQTGPEDAPGGPGQV
jgi:hypothetical protein